MEIEEGREGRTGKEATAEGKEEGKRKEKENEKERKEKRKENEKKVNKTLKEERCPRDFNILPIKK